MPTSRFQSFPPILVGVYVVVNLCASHHFMLGLFGGVEGDRFHVSLVHRFSDME